jgi:hypothetical protein
LLKVTFAKLHFRSDKQDTEEIFIINLLHYHQPVQFCAVLFACHQCVAICKCRYCQEERFRTRPQRAVLAVAFSALSESMAINKGSKRLIGPDSVV